MCTLRTQAFACLLRLQRPSWLLLHKDWRKRPVLPCSPQGDSARIPRAESPPSMCGGWKDICSSRLECRRSWLYSFILRGFFALRFHRVREGNHLLYLHSEILPIQWVTPRTQGNSSLLHHHAYGRVPCISANRMLSFACLSNVIKPNENQFLISIPFYTTLIIIDSRTSKPRRQFGAQHRADRKLRPMGKDSCSMDGKFV